MRVASATCAAMGFVSAAPRQTRRAPASHAPGPAPLPPPLPPPLPIPSHRKWRSGSRRRPVSPRHYTNPSYAQNFETTPSQVHGAVDGHSDGVLVHRHAGGSRAADGVHRHAAGHAPPAAAQLSPPTRRPSVRDSLAPRRSAIGDSHRC